MAIFPSTIPAPLLGGYTPRRKKQTIESDMEVGPSLSRRVSTAREYTVQIEISVTGEQLASFTDWWDSSSGAAGGSAWFSGLLLDLGDGLGVRSNVECNIVGGVYETPRNGKNKWLLKFTVDTR